MARSTPQQWAHRVEDWEASGLTAAAYARKTGISDRSLRWWKWQLKARGFKSEPKTPLTFVEMTSAMAREPFEVVLENRVRVRIPHDFDAAALERLLGVVGRQR